MQNKPTIECPKCSRKHWGVCRVSPAIAKIDRSFGAAYVREPYMAFKSHRFGQS